MSARRALLTGAAGFVGASLVRRLLDEGHAVELITRPGSDLWRLQEVRGSVTLHEADLRDELAVQRAVDAAAPDWVFHLAAHGAYSWQRNARDIFDSNVLGTLNLARASVRREFEAFVHAGSSSEYGFKDHAPSEQEAPEPNSDYAVAKVAATLLCAHLAAQHQLRMATLRLYSVYGPWEDPRRLIPTLVAHGLRGELPPLVKADTARDFVHVDDVCEALMLAATTPVEKTNGIYNVGSGIQTTLRELVEIARQALSIAAEPEWDTFAARSWDLNVWVADPSKIERELGWRPQRGLLSGLEGFASWLAQADELRTRYGTGA
jgi:nucleoside-diphosphate-sugar epimerase